MENSVTTPIEMSNAIRTICIFIIGLKWSSVFGFPSGNGHTTDALYPSIMASENNTLNSGTQNIYIYIYADISTVVVSATGLDGLGSFAAQKNEAKLET